MSQRHKLAETLLRIAGMPEDGRGPAMNVVTRAIRLAEMRERHGLSQEQLAERLGLSEEQVVDLESGEISAARQLRLILMRYFDCRFEDLFEVAGVDMEDSPQP